MVMYQLRSIGVEYEREDGKIKPVHFVENWRKDRRDTYANEPSKAFVVLQIAYSTDLVADLEADVYIDGEYQEHITMHVDKDNMSQSKEYTPAPNSKFELRNVSLTANRADAEIALYVGVGQDYVNNYVQTILRADGRIICELMRDGEQIYWQEHDLMSVLYASQAISATKAVADIMVNFMGVMLTFMMVIQIIRSMMEMFMGAIRL